MTLPEDEKERLNDNRFYNPELEGIETAQSAMALGAVFEAAMLALFIGLPIGLVMSFLFG